MIFVPLPQNQVTKIGKNKNGTLIAQSAEKMTSILIFSNINIVKKNGKTSKKTSFYFPTK